MNLKEANTFIETELDRAGIEYPTEEIRRLINQEQDFIARELRIPRKYWTGLVPGTTAYVPPTTVRSNGILAFYNNSTGRNYELLTVQQAYGKYPGWTRTDFSRKIIVYDTAGDLVSYTFRGFDSDDVLDFSAIMKPNDLDDDADTFFNDEFDEWHILVPRKVVADILLKEGLSMIAQGKPEAMGTAIIRLGEIQRGRFDQEMKSAFAQAWDYDSYNYSGAR